MAMSPVKIYKSVSMVAGENFVLPPGAKLIGANTPSNITSNCELPVFETYQCYDMLFGYNKASDAEVVDSDTILEIFLGTELKGSVVLNDFYIPFPQTTTPFLADSFPTGLILNEVLTVVNTISNAISFRVTFRTLPSIASALKFKMSGRGFGGATLPNEHGLFVYPVIATDCEGIPV